MSKHIHIHLDSGKRTMDADVSYKGYLIRHNSMSGDYWIVKDGKDIGPNQYSLEACKEYIDTLIKLGLNDHAN